MEHLYRRLVENSLGFMCVHDLDGVLLYVSPAAARALGWTPADGVGRNLRDYLAPAARPFFGAYLDRIRHNPSDSGLMRLLARDGSERVWSYRNVRVEEPGLPACVLGHAVDVTSAVHTRQALQEANLQIQERDARHETLVEGSPIGICVEQDGLIRFANAAAARLHGHDDPAALVGRPAAGVVAEEQRRGLRVERRSSPVTWEHRPALLSAVLDVTDRPGADTRGAQTEEAVAWLAGSVAHHLNNLMTVVLGWAELLRDSFEAGDPRRTNGEMVLQAGTRAAAMARQLLAFSGRQILRTQPLDLARFLAHLAPRIRESAGPGVAVEIAIDATPREVRADATQLEHAVLALADNARDAMPAGGRLVLRAGNADVDPALAAEHPEMRPGAYAVLAVEDSGAGMTDEVRARAFEPFFTTRLTGEHAGLGLASVRGIVRQHEGHVAVDSRPGAGTTVRIYLPRHADAAG